MGQSDIPKMYETKLIDVLNADPVDHTHYNDYDVWMDKEADHHQ